MKFLKIILGAGKNRQEGWLSLQENELNLLNEKDFEKYCQVNSVEAFLAEHVFEHLSETEGRLAAQNLYKFLKPGGYIRLAVPDKNFDNKSY